MRRLGVVLMVGLAFSGCTRGSVPASSVPLTEVAAQAVFSSDKDANACRRICDFPPPGVTYDRCLSEQYRNLTTLEIFLYVRQQFLPAGKAGFCKAQHEEVMSSRRIGVPRYDCHRLELERTVEVERHVWLLQCSKDMPEWWCEFDPQKNIYAFVQPVYDGPDCDMLMPW